MTDYTKIFHPAGNDTSGEIIVAAAESCLDGFTACFNNRDRVGMDAYLHFPHVLFSGAEWLVREKPGQLPADFFDTLVKSGWEKTVYEAKEPMLVSAEQVHFRVRYTRRATDGRILTEHENVWIVTRINDRWGIALRSYYN
jgi:hypothetical protein